MDPTPASLLLRLRAPGDASAWRRFVELYTPLLYSWASRLGLKAEDAADLVQDVLAVLVQRLPSFENDPSRQFRGFLRTVIENRWRDLMRRRAARPLRTGENLDALAAPDGIDLAEEEYRRLVMDRAVRVMQADFEPNTWRAFWAVVVDGRPPAEVAVELGLSVDGVYQARSRVLRRLRQELAGLME